MPLTTLTLQAASFVTPVWTVLLLVEALDGRHTSPIPAPELVSTAGAQRCQGRVSGEGQRPQALGQLSSPPAPHIHPRQERNQWLSLGVFGGHRAKAQDGETEAQRGGRPRPGSHSALAGKARTKTEVSCSARSPLSPAPPSGTVLWNLGSHYLVTSPFSKPFLSAQDVGMGDTLLRAPRPLTAQGCRAGRRGTGDHCVDVLPDAGAGDLRLRGTQPSRALRGTWEKPWGMSRPRRRGGLGWGLFFSVPRSPALGPVGDCLGPGRQGWEARQGQGRVPGGHRCL